jgi:ligand-binding SRPBCC domain-containing protein
VSVAEFRSELWLPAPLERIFDFFSDAGNLQELTPGWVNFEIVTPRPILLRAGTLIDYRLRIRGIPVTWRTLIKVWDPPFRFVDEQVRGPYRKWEHEHTFEAKDGGTLMRDCVTYAAPFGFLTHALFVNRDVRRIFEFRRETLLKREWQGDA